MSREVNILYIDDDLEDQEFFKEALSTVAPDANCYFARDGVQALNLLDSMVLAPQYIFLDLNMPNMDGKQFLFTISQSDFKDIPVIVFTTSQNPKDRDECKKLGASSYCSKPPNYTGICDMLKTTLVP